LYILIKIRVFLSWYLISKFKFGKRYFLAKLISPSTTTLVGNRPRKDNILPKPNYTHLIYHQSTVDELCAENSIKSIIELNQISFQDEIIFYNNGSNFDIKRVINIKQYDWFSDVFSKSDTPEKKSYTYGLNHLLIGSKAENIIFWRTDYVYPPGYYEKMVTRLANNNFVSPYNVIIGEKYCNSAFVAKNFDKLKNYDLGFWTKNGNYLSLYETQDPALFGIKKSLWLKIDGLNNQLWGYGWQFAEFAARVRLNTSQNKIDYFLADPPFHQTHEGTQMHQEQDNQHKKREFNDGLARFSKFLGGEKALSIYKFRWILKPTDQAISEQRQSKSN